MRFLLIWTATIYIKVQTAKGVNYVRCNTVPGLERRSQTQSWSRNERRLVA